MTNGTCAICGRAIPSRVGAGRPRESCTKDCGRIGTEAETLRKAILRRVESGLSASEASALRSLVMGIANEIQCDAWAVKASHANRRRILLGKIRKADPVCVRALLAWGRAVRVERRIAA